MWFPIGPLNVLVLYLERPLRNSVHLHAPIGALLIHRLEGSRPDGRLCTLNGSARVRRVKQDAGMAMIRDFESGFARRRVAS
jgi:hypothetical protein